jgi:2-pyrone-4,6-dicarboxylate lactonase
MDQFPSFDPNTRTPDPLPPRGSYDTQVHIYGDPERYPGRSGRSYDPPRAGFDDVLRMHRALGVDHGVIVQPTTYGTDHRLLLDTLAISKDYRGVAIVDDTLSDKDLLRLHEAGVRGARFNFVKHLQIVPSTESFRRSIARIQELGWFAKIYADLLEHEQLLRSLTLPVVIDHMGRVDISLGLKQPTCAFILDMLKNHGWWIMISNGDRWSRQGPPWDDVIPFAEAFVEAAPERTIWGTDWPHIQYRRQMANDADLLELLYRSAPDVVLRQKILVDNPARLLATGA